MSRPRPPKLDALVLCRSIVTDEGRTRWDLEGVIRGRLESGTFPLELPALGVYIVLTGMRGSYELLIEVLNAATQQVLRSIRTTKPIVVDDPLRVVTECIEIPNTVFRNRGRHACRLSVNGAFLHETAFDVDWPKPPEVKGRMSPASFARGMQRIREREPGVEDARMAAAAGVGPELLRRMQTDFSGLDPEAIQEALTRLCHHFRIRPEEFLEGFE